MIQYITMEDFELKGFPFIQQVLAAEEPVPDYLSEASGISELMKVMEFVKQDLYYPTFYEKAAYLISSIAGSQYFSNGNKRLAIATLMLFLAKNEVKIIKGTDDGYREILRIKFPLHTWENNSNIKEAHALFLYNLTFVIGDRTRWGTNDFSVIRENVSAMFNYLYEMD